ncbi:hypothetical protein LINPERHAP2_LOCUS6096 [Linum perenne]
MMIGFLPYCRILKPPSLASIVHLAYSLDDRSQRGCGSGKTGVHGGPEGSASRVDFSGTFSPCLEVSQVPSAPVWRFASLGTFSVSSFFRLLTVQLGTGRDDFSMEGVWLDFVPTKISGLIWQS